MYSIQLYIVTQTDFNIWRQWNCSFSSRTVWVVCLIYSSFTRQCKYKNRNAYQCKNNEFMFFCVLLCTRWPPFCNNIVYLTLEIWMCLITSSICKWEVTTSHCLLKNQTNWNFTAQSLTDFLLIKKNALNKPNIYLLSVRKMSWANTEF